MTEPEWSWEAHYLDGTVLKQHGHSFKDIDQSRLHHFSMCKEGKQIIIIWNPSYKLIHFYRVKHLYVGSPQEALIRLYCFGYQFGNVKNIFVIMPDDGIVVTDDIDKVRIV